MIEIPDLADFRRALRGMSRETLACMMLAQPSPILREAIEAEIERRKTQGSAAVMVALTIGECE